MPNWSDPLSRSIFFRTASLAIPRSLGMQSNNSQLLSPDTVVRRGRTARHLPSRRVTGSQAGMSDQTRAARPKPRHPRAPERQAAGHPERGSGVLPLRMEPSSLCRGVPEVSSAGPHAQPAAQTERRPCVLAKQTGGWPPVVRPLSPRHVSRRKGTTWRSLGGTQAERRREPAQK